MNYIKVNKEAWEEAFSHRKNGWGEDVAEMILAYPMRMMVKACRYPSLLVSEKE